MGLKSSRIKLPPKEYKALLHQVFTRDGWRCRIPGCGRRNDLHGHHLKFRSQGGDDIVDNLLTICTHCHDAIHGQAAKRDQRLIILPMEEDKEFDANGDLKFIFLKGWTPSRRVAM